MNEFEMEFRRKLKKYRSLCHMIEKEKSSTEKDRLQNELYFYETIILNFVKYYRGVNQNAKK